MHSFQLFNESETRSETFSENPILAISLDFILLFMYVQYSHLKHL